MFVDASALVAILAQEPGYIPIGERLHAASSRSTSGLAVFEAVMAVARLKQLTIAAAEAHVRDFLQAAAIAIVPIADAEAREALAAFARFGKGQGHPAQLNMGDCFAYACARTCKAELLFVGNDFSRTDIVP
ncbi:twitching motility protein PilT [Methylobacterium tarhaniae]|uniref:Ribonuclease VapC n=1 Tax=Methylobacterium tarhaniae TaxID=1187852 RepID=A0A0J6SJR5_9HYPH|nr:type II toxin-antitoxin system VapC family toxin [Methylobacterium tarhaniae]KMO33608.1 twitching motility protein PilT [Methylobacterium tarhaniae]